MCSVSLKALLADLDMAVGTSPERATTSGPWWIGAPVVMGGTTQHIISNVIDIAIGLFHIAQTSKIRIFIRLRIFILYGKYWFTYLYIHTGTNVIGV
jgi:hypothetical protein